MDTFKLSLVIILFSNMFVFPVGQESCSNNQQRIKTLLDAWHYLRSQKCIPRLSFLRGVFTERQCHMPKEEFYTLVAQVFSPTHYHVEELHNGDLAFWPRYSKKYSCADPVCPQKRFGDETYNKIIEHLKTTPNKVFTNGRFGCAQELIKTGPDFLRDWKFGYVLELVQLLANYGVLFFKHGQVHVGVLEPLLDVKMLNTLSTAVCMHYEGLGHLHSQKWVAVGQVEMCFNLQQMDEERSGYCFQICNNMFKKRVYKSPLCNSKRLASKLCLKRIQQQQWRHKFSDVILIWRNIRPRVESVYNPVWCLDMLLKKEGKSAMYFITERPEDIFEVMLRVSGVLKTSSCMAPTVHEGKIKAAAEALKMFSFKKKNSGHMDKWMDNLFQTSVGLHLQWP